MPLLALWSHRCPVTLLPGISKKVAPGVPTNRPPFGQQPVRNITNSRGNITEMIENNWYEGLQMKGNTSLNPYFYGTYLAETLPGEPVHRTKKQAFQADAICAMNQMVEDHFQHMHTFRLEWQPGEGGRIDWFVQGYKVVNETTGETFYMTGDGKGKDWYPAYTITDDVLKHTEGAQIPIEPSYLIFNTAVSSTWGFPYDVPDECPTCYDCGDLKCACNFNKGFCDMIGGTPEVQRKYPSSLYNPDGVHMLIDSVRVYQSRDDNAHVGAPHTLGCDPPEYPTRQFIKANEYKYSRPPPWVYQDKGPLRENIQKGGGACETDADCGDEGEDQRSNGTIALENSTTTNETTSKASKETITRAKVKRGYCGSGILYENHERKGLSINGVCVCNDGFTGPRCLAIDHKDTFPSAMKLRMGKSMFKSVQNSLHIPSLVWTFVLLMILSTFANTFNSVRKKRIFFAHYNNYKHRKSSNSTDGTANSPTTKSSPEVIEVDEGESGGFLRRRITENYKESLRDLTQPTEEIQLLHNLPQEVANMSNAGEEDVISVTGRSI